MDLTSALAAGTLGAVVGAGAALAWRRPRRRAAEAVDDEEGTRPQERLPEGATAVLSVLPGGAAVVDRLGRAVWATPPALSWSLVRDGRISHPLVMEAVRAVHADGGSSSLEVELRRRRGTRGRLVAVHVAPLAEELAVVLAEDRSDAQRVDAVRRDFVANVSHELKTPVGALSLLAEAVADAKDDPEAVERFAGRMQHEASRLTSLVNELIDLSRLQGDDPMRHATVVQLDDVVHDAVDRVRTLATAHSIELRVAGERRRVVYGDREQLTMAVRNLLINAVNYSPERTHVVVAVHGVGDTVEVSVSDQGIGIPPRDLERIFERFYRVDPARSRATGGTGLGLSIVKHVCANHGGEVAVWSVEGSGSTFTLRLPAHTEPARALAEDSSDSAAADDAVVQPLRKVVP